MNLFISLLRAAPALVFSISLILFIITRIDIYLLLSIVITVGETINTVLKHYVFKPIMKNKYWPILGYGTRPKNSKNSAQFGNINTPPYKGSYGMPSGHAQQVVSEATYIIVAFQNPYSSILSIIVAALTIYQRYIYQKHTAIQLAVGTIVGVFTGGTFYSFISNKL